MNKIFVTGPTGTQGFPIVKELLAKGFQIRAFALESDPKLPQLKELGPNVEVVCGVNEPRFSNIFIEKRGSPL